MGRAYTFASLSLAFLAVGCGGRSSLLDGAAGGTCSPGQQRSCYTGPPGTQGIGICEAGGEVCSAAAWGPCTGEVLPSPEVCDGIDNDCNGTVDDGCPCPVGKQQSCYTGPPGTAGVGICKAGSEVCSAAGWAPCTGEVLPAMEVCDGVDNDCNGIVDDGCPCIVGQKEACYDGPPGTQGMGQCKAGVKACSVMGWGPCVGEVLPSAEACDLVDNNCDGQVDEGTCPDGFTCGTSIALTDPPILWNFNGVAKYDLPGTGPTGILTGGNIESGTMIYNNPIVTDSFVAKFQIALGADGLGFMLETSGPKALGGASGGFGMAGLAGYGIEFDIHQDACGGDPPATHVGIDDLSQVCGPLMAHSVLVSMFTAPVSLPGLRNSYPMEIDFDQGMVTVIVNGATVVSGFPIPGFPVGQPFYYGFGGSNGYIMTPPITEVIQNVSITFPTPRCL